MMTAPNDLTESELRAAIVAEAESWIGTKYHNHARVKGVGVDCGQLLLGVYGAVGILPVDFDVGYYPEQWHMNRDEERYLGIVKSFGHEIPGPPKPGDAVMFKFGKCFSHGGIVTEWPMIVHAIRLANVTLENVERCTFGPRALANIPRKYFSYWAPVE